MLQPELRAPTAEEPAAFCLQLCSQGRLGRKHTLKEPGRRGDPVLTTFEGRWPWGHDSQTSSPAFCRFTQ